MTGHVLVVGASLSGLRLAEQLRGLGHTGPVTIAGAETRMPYNRPPLSKDVLTGDDDEATLVQSLSFRPRPTLDDVTWKLGATAVACDLAARRVSFADSSTLSYDALAIATGLSPRRVPLSGGEKDRYVLRTLDDALALRARLIAGARLAVIGAGFIGCEVAASARKRGLAVTMIETFEAPMQRAIGIVAGQAMQALHRSEGIDFRLQSKITGFVDRGDGHLDGIRLETGEMIACDLAVEAVGSTANTAWLVGNGLDLSDGVLCDNAMRVEGRADVVAAGDIARFPNLFADHVPRRIEHWTVPGFTAKRAAESLVKEMVQSSFAPLPAFWSDQHGLRLQSYGSPSLGDASELLEGSLCPDDMRRQGVALGYRRAGRMIGVVLIGLPAARLAHYRNLVDVGRET
ncbi:NAD(P)/FAD-dependent oxidoreductase [Aestuariivirga sp. YIM B02566]|uniref:FAD-dependent oxidoreductase n=1 Tax=Taklimakanibacter albus TaxID=2800327 RepID=A0ACC5R4Q6_9HYPH|nr:FAD-dependent oxidoreductase [Aestuariivirga sp. YIM B02566]MBK1867595.1 FAD-dependent oxidoreductase [Aestuariivirga sp. YIM B02566]